MANGKTALPVIAGLQRAAPALAVLGAVLCVLGLLTQRDTFFEGYLYAFVFWGGLTLGCFSLTLLMHVVKARWGRPVLRMLEAGSRMLLPMAILFLPIALGNLLGFHHLYPWADPARVQSDPVLQHRAPYMNSGFFFIRYVVYFAIWIFMSSKLNAWSLEQDRTGDPHLQSRRTNLSAPGIVLFVITLTLAFTDWVMTLDPHWFSTIYGLWFLVGQALSALSFTVLLATSMSKRSPYREALDDGTLRDLGNMLLTTTMLWGYVALSQFLIMWSGNLPEEVGYYFKRQRGVWLGMGAFIMFGQFFAPFLALLSGRTKRTARLLQLVAGGILAVRMVDLFWSVMPFFKPSLMQVAWSAAAWLFMGGVWFIFFTASLKRFPLIPSWTGGTVPEAHGHGAEVYEHA